MQDFRFHRPKTLAEAARLLAEADEGKLLAGGQSLLPVMKLDLAAHSDLISIRELDDLRGIRRVGDAIEIGAAMTHAQVAEAAVVREAIPALAALAGAIGDPQVRNRGTLGGSVAHADPAADYPAAVLALDAVVVTDKRKIAAGDYFTGMFETALAPGEIITAVRFAVPQAAHYAKFPNPASRYAIVGVMVARHAGGVRVAVTGAGPSAFRATALETALNERFAADALDGVSAAEEDELVSDLHADAAYRAHLIHVMARRAVAACA
ncbi:FAD binding domain-containing protein [Haliangium sp.]|uniref:FAD binding domain-containing protein n=1 Tax=Haliangium sp. TaxID=2663208 RepID=UPI003D130A10